MTISIKCKNNEKSETIEIIKLSVIKNKLNRNFKVVS